MNAAEALRGTTRLFLDSAPVIYHVESHPVYSGRVGAVFDLIGEGSLAVVTSPITLAECLVIPYRRGLPELRELFADVIVDGPNTIFAPLDHETGRCAAELRAIHNLSLTDAFQIATALQAGCEAILTNDEGMRRITELRVVMVGDLDD